MSTAALNPAKADVNAAFAAERSDQLGRIERSNAEAAAYNALPAEQRQAQADAAQLARFEERVKNGELVDLGNGRYQSTQGWDQGEIWTVQRSRTDDKLMLALPEHGLDTDKLTGRAKLYTAVPAWHSLGTEIPGGITDVEDVIRLGQLDVPAVSIPAPDFAVPGLEGTFKAPGAFYLANGDTGEFWGTVGKVHKNIPVRESFAFLQNLVDDGELIWQSAGLMGEGRKVFISATLPDGITIDAEGINDFCEMFLVVQDARDGSAAYKGMITPWRPVCGNTNRFALRDAVAVVTLRHTSGFAAQMEKARKALGMTLAYREQFAAEETALARTAIKTAEFEALMAEITAEGLKDGELAGRVFGARDKDGESTRAAGANDRRETDLMDRFAAEKERVGSSLYAAEQAYTGYLDWGIMRKGKTPADRWLGRVQANLSGSEDKAKSSAHAKLLALTSR
jgi:phage/plasmid-like protein (TIGR03299 family)